MNTSKMCHFVNSKRHLHKDRMIRSNVSWYNQYSNNNKISHVNKLRSRRISSG